MYFYKIAGIKLKVDCENEYLISRLQPFRNEIDTDYDMSIRIIISDWIDKPNGDLLVDDQIQYIRKPAPDKGFFLVRYDKDQNLVKAVLDTDDKWKNIAIKCLHIVWPKDVRFPETFTASWVDYHTFHLTGIAFRYSVLLYDGIVIHSSSLSLDGKGILFTAPSGTGKSTHAGLYEKHFGDRVKVINDDTPVVRFIDDTPYVYGTPWSGSSDKYENLEVPLKAIVVLKQAPKNRIRKLSTIEALPLVMPRVFMPYFDNELMERAYKLLDSLLGKVPIYHLECRPDQEAMEMSLECIK